MFDTCCSAASERGHAIARGSFYTRRVHRLFVVALTALAAPAVALTACSDSPAACDGPCDAQPRTAWQQGPAMPRRALDPGVVVLGQQIIVAGGFDTGASEGLHVTTRVEAFDLASETWGRLPDAPVAWTNSNLAVIGPTLYLAGGLDGAQAEAQGDGYLLDPFDQAWKPIAAMPAGDARGAAGVASAPGRLYLLGGASSTQVLDSCLEYNITADAWSTLPPLPVARAHPAAMRMTDGTLIVAGGFASLDTSEPLDDVWALPPPGAVPREWRARTPMQSKPELEARGGCAYGVVLGELVCAGGAAGPAARNTVGSYDPYTDVWTVRESMPIDHTGTPGVASGGRLFVPGGAATLAREPTDTLYLYAPLDTAPR